MTYFVYEYFTKIWPLRLYKEPSKLDQILKSAESFQFWSLAKVVLSFECGSWNSNLKWFLVKGHKGKKNIEGFLKNNVCVVLSSQNSVRNIHFTWRLLCQKTKQSEIGVSCYQKWVHILNLFLVFNRK